jgi:membrane-associated phospholipid phosphatase
MALRSGLKASPSPVPGHAHRFSWRGIAFVVLLAAFVVVTLGVIFRSPILSLDTDLVKLDLRHRYPQWKGPIVDFVLFGQRGPATFAFLPYFVWVAWRKRSTQPLVLLGTALVLLNVGVGIVKLATGRLGPLRTHQVHDVFVGGNIYPSGHVSNTVVLYGLVAWIAIKYRKFAIGAAVFLSITVGLATVYLDTHWFSDVIGGWIAGGLILLALPTAMPFTQRWADAAVEWARTRLARRRAPAGEDRDEPAGVGAAIRYRLAQGNVTPVSSLARSHSLAATTASFDALDEPTRRGCPRISPSPSGP